MIVLTREDNIEYLRQYDSDRNEHVPNYSKMNDYELNEYVEIMFTLQQIIEGA